MGCSGWFASAGPACSMYWAWPPSRHAGITTRRAVRAARSEPACWRIRCKHKSKPEATPADVRTGPSSMNRTLGSTSMCGYRRANSPAHCQCVVARLPSNNPAAASVKAPTHMAAMRAPFPAAACSAEMTCGSGCFQEPMSSWHDHEVRVDQRVHPVRRVNLDQTPVGRRADRRALPTHPVILVWPAASRPAAPILRGARLAMPKTWPGIMSSKPMTCSSANTPMIIVARS